MVEALACKAGLSGFESHRYLQFLFTTSSVTPLLNREGTGRQDTATVKERIVVAEVNYGREHNE